MLRWAMIEVNGTPVKFAGVHLARPFYPKLQYADVVTLADFVRHQTGPLIVAGDFNMTPWTDKLTGFTQATGLERYNTFHFTWPLHVGGIPLLPFVATDHVFASPHFAKIATCDRADRTRVIAIIGSRRQLRRHRRFARNRSSRLAPHKECGGRRPSPEDRAKTNR